MTIVCIDTQVLYWAVVQRAPNGRDDLVRMSIDFMEWIQKQKADVIIPTIVVGEMLVPIPEDEHIKVMTTFNRDWMIVEYDLRSAREFARLRQNQLIKERFKDIREIHPDVTRKELVADAMIIATAIAHGAEVIYSHNRDLRSLAEGFIRAENIDNAGFQMSLGLSNKIDSESQD